MLHTHYNAQINRYTLAAMAIKLLAFVTISFNFPSVCLTTPCSEHFCWLFTYEFRWKFILRAYVIAVCCYNICLPYTNITIYIDSISKFCLECNAHRICKQKWNHRWWKSNEKKNIQICICIALAFVYFILTSQFSLADRCWYGNGCINKNYCDVIATSHTW